VDKGVTMKNIILSTALIFTAAIFAWSEQQNFNHSRKIRKGVTVLRNLEYAVADGSLLTKLDLYLPKKIYRIRNRC